MAHPVWFTAHSVDEHTCFKKRLFNNVAITMYGATWVLEISGATLCKECNCLTTMLHT